MSFCGREIIKEETETGKKPRASCPFFGINDRPH
jgi:hypothetical protein